MGSFFGLVEVDVNDWKFGWIAAASLDRYLVLFVMVAKTPRW